jgi:hypothetical protein
MKLVTSPITIGELSRLAQQRFGDLVKAVVDVDRRLMAIDAELHSDEEAVLLEDGSEQRSLWGVNLYPELAGDDLVEFDSMINIRPSQGNRSRGIDDAETRARVRAVVDSLVVR